MEGLVESLQKWDDSIVIFKYKWLNLTQLEFNKQFNWTKEKETSEIKKIDEGQMNISS